MRLGHKRFPRQKTLLIVRFKDNAEWLRSWNKRKGKKAMQFQ